MRILHVSHQYPPDRLGGVEVYTQALAHRQAARHAVAILHGWADRVNSGPLVLVNSVAEDSGPHNGTRVWATTPNSPRHPLELFIRSFHNPAVDRAFVSLLSEFRPDVVHVQHLKGLSARLVPAAARAGIPVVWTLHDWWAFCANAQLVVGQATGGQGLTTRQAQLCDGPRLWLNCAQCAIHHDATHLTGAARVAGSLTAPAIAMLFAYRDRLLKAALHAADQLIAPTQFVRDRFARQGVAASRIRVVEHGIDLSGVQTRVPGDGRLRVGYVGGLAWQKGVHILVEAFNRLPPDAAELTLYGDPHPFPAYVAALQASIRHPRIRLAGPFKAAERWTRLAELDLIVVPSLWPETSSLVVQEAFAAGAPVIATRVGALADRVRDGVDGYLVPVGDVAALAASLRRLIAEPGELVRLRAGVRPPRSLDTHAAEIEAIYSALLEKAQRRHFAS